MPSWLPRVHYRSLPSLLAISFVPLLANAWATSSPPAPIPSDDSSGSREQVLEHRHAEAAVKTARVATQLRSENLRTANQNDWDVIHYDLDLTVDHTIQSLSGVVTTTADVLVSSLATFDLNLSANMAISAITVNGGTASWSRAGQVVTVNLDRVYSSGETVAVAVTYSGNPQGGAFTWSSADDKPLISTLSEPYGARDWWPCKDDNRDKADSLDLHVTVREPLIAVSNGTLVSTTPAAGWTTYEWHSDYPITTYLVSLAIHPYSTFSHQYTPLAGGAPMPVDYYVYESRFNIVQPTYALTVPMLEAFAAGYGEYPFVDEKYGHAEFSRGGGMEHQTISSLGGHSEDLIAHELAHQWWGDMVTCEDFGHIWLNEGFATWSEAYWKEQSQGLAAYKLYMTWAAYYGPGTVFVEDPSNFGSIFNVNLSYNKASWVVHMLRGVLGDEDFFAGLAHYRDLYEYSTATTEQFRDAMEDVSGQDLDAFFQQWIYGEYFPIYAQTWRRTTADELEVTIEQKQVDTGLFTMPITLRIETSNGSQDFVVQNSLAVETYNLPVSGTVNKVRVDPDKWILRQVVGPVTDPAFDAGILVVNGVDWNTYDPEIQSAYADSVFWDDLPYTFWDTFPTPSGGYPPNLSAPLGHGSIPHGILGNYSAVVWVGNHQGGDLSAWVQTSIGSYLGAGGNVLLLARHGKSFLEGSLTDYLGIQWQAEGVALDDLIAVHGGLEDIPLSGTQTLNDVFSKSALGPHSTLLFESHFDGSAQTEGSGVIVVPPTGGTHRADGGRLAHIAGRSYRMDHAALRANVRAILENWFSEPFSPGLGIDDPGTVGERFLLSAGVPNPFHASTALTFSLPTAGPARVAVYDVGGRLVRTLVHGEQPAGQRTVTWDGIDGKGRRAAAGVYFVKLRTATGSQTQSIVRMR